VVLDLPTRSTWIGFPSVSVSVMKTLRMRLWFVLPVRVPPPNDGFGGEWWVNQPSILTYGIFLRRGCFDFDGGGDCRPFFTLDSWCSRDFILCSRDSLGIPFSNLLFPIHLHLCWYSSTPSAPPFFIPLISIVRQCLPIGLLDHSLGVPSFYYMTHFLLTIYRLVSVAGNESYK